MRDLTFQEDKLPALSGLATKFGNVTGFRYIAGSWVETLLYDLTWQSEIEPPVEPDERLGLSFSWVSTPGAVNYRFARHSYPGCRIPHTEVVSHTYSTVDGHKYSRAREGSSALIVRGPTVEARLETSSTDRKSYKSALVIWYTRQTLVKGRSVNLLSMHMYQTGLHNMYHRHLVQACAS